MSSARYLTKSRFKLAMECPTKLFYSGKDKTHEFVNTKLDDEFLRSLAEGGFQVGELAKLMYPDGIEVKSIGHETALAETIALLERDEVTIFEAAIRYQNLFIRIDILKKRGRHFELIEVKAKSYDPTDDEFFCGKRGGIKSTILPYLQDVAFQKHVLSKAYPDSVVASRLMLADKSKQASVDRLNQKFKIRRDGERSRVATEPSTDADSIGTALLTAVPVDLYVNEILGSPLSMAGCTLPFAEAIALLADHYQRDEAFPPMIGSHCGKCEFRTPQPDQRSGFHRCWKQANGWSDDEFSGGTVLDIWNFRGKDKLIEQGVLRLKQVTEDDLNIKSGEDGLSRSERQWMQVSGQWPGGGDSYLDRDGLAAAMSDWRYPLHFIDFETSRVAVPFHIGRRPYEQVAFQFSHHVAHEDGRIEHKGQFLNAAPGAFPNYAFVRELRRQLIADEGTILRWAAHENTVLREIWQQLEEDPAAPTDKVELQAFILDITSDSRTKRVGKRSMVDLCRMAEQLYFHPLTNGSSSIKKVLAAVLSSSEFLRDRYSKPIYGAVNGIASLNFHNWAWWRQDGSTVIDPYSLLPPMFDDLDDATLDSLSLDDEAVLANGGAALIAYARLQYENIDSLERERIKTALLKYCELDTLAMVLIWQTWLDD